MKSGTVGYITGSMACLALIFTTLHMWPGVSTTAMCVAVALDGALIAATARYIEWRSPVSTIAVMIAATLSLCAVAINVNYYTVAFGADAAHPVLQNFDAERDWQWACHYAYGDAVTKPEYLDANTGQSSLYALLLLIFGRSVAVPVIFCSLCYTAALVLGGGVAYRLSGSRRVAAITTVVTASMCYLWAQSACMIKDCPVTMCMAGYIYLLARRCRCDVRPGICDALSMTAILLLLGVLRGNMLLMAALVAGIMLPAMPRRSYVAVAATIAGALAARWGVQAVLDHVCSQVMDTVTAEPHILIVQSTPYTAPLDNLIGDYTTMPFYRKLLLLPLSIAVQFLLPFPWNYSRDMIYGPAECVAHFGYTWYVAGALVLYWIFSARLRQNPALTATVAAGVVLYALTAYISSGRVSRYCLPLLPLLLPAAATVIDTSLRRRSLHIWMTAFGVLLAAALVICHHMQSSC